MIGKKTANKIFASDMTIIMVGAKGSGKTNFASVLMEMLVSLGYQIWTNIHFFDYDDVEEAIKINKLKKDIEYHKKPDEVHVVSTTHELLKGLVGKGKKVVFLDEAGIHASSSQPMSKATVSIKQLAYIIRHFDACLVIIAQVEGSIPPDLREKLVDWKIKVAKSRRSISFGKREVVEDEFGDEHITFPTNNGYQHIKHSQYPYDSNFPSGFEIDMDLKKALAELSKLGSSIEVMKYGADVIEKLHKESKKNGPKTLSKKDLVIAAFENGNNNLKEVSKMCNTGYQYVKGIHSDWKRGM